MTNQSNDNISWADIKYVGNEIKYSKEAIDSSWIAGGEFINRFETKIEEIFSGRAFSVSNGTAALQLAIQALGLKAGDKVIVPSFCFQAAANVILQLGGIPIYCDVNLCTWNQSLKDIKDVANTNIAGVIVVHNYGACHDIKNIADWCDKHEIWLIEDCAEAWFSKYDNKYLGQYSDIATFSMHAAKTITCGEGGLLISYREDLNEKISQLRSHGLVNAPRPYFNQLAGNNYRLSNIHAAIALGQLEGYKAILKSQNLRQFHFENNLKTIPYGSVQQIIDKSISLWAIGFRIFTGFMNITRDEVMDLLKDQGIDTRPGFYSSDKLPYSIDKSVYPVSSQLSDEIIVFPCGTLLTETDIDRVSSAFKKILDTYKKFDLVPFSTERDHLSFEAFLRKVNEKENFFRYFDNRDYSVLQNHIETLLVKNGEEIIAYGHLDEEEGSVWLGICVCPAYQGLTIGRAVMSYLLNIASSKGVNTVVLSVDKNNIKAKLMYEKIGFETVEATEKTYKMRFILNG